MTQQIEFKDVQVFQDALDDQDTVMSTIEIKRCESISYASTYPGEKPTVTRRSIFTRAEVKPIALGETDLKGGNIAVGDLEIRCNVEIRGSQQKEWDVGDKKNPETVSDIIALFESPYQGEWYVLGIPEPGQIRSGQFPLFWNVNIRRIKTGAIAK